MNLFDKNADRPEPRPPLGLATCCRCGSDDTYRLVTRLEMKGREQKTFVLCAACCEALDGK